MSPEPDDLLDIVIQKVQDIFGELVGERAERIEGPIGDSSPAMDAITAALTPNYGSDKAREIAFNMADWNWDAAFVTALQLFPERFTAAEINAGIGLFLVHAPYHIEKAGDLYNDPLPDDDEGASNSANLS